MLARLTRIGPKEAQRRALREGLKPRRSVLAVKAPVPRGARGLSTVERRRKRDRERKRVVRAANPERYRKQQRLLMRKRRAVAKQKGNP